MGRAKPASLVPRDDRCWAGVDVGESVSFLSVIGSDGEPILEQAVPTEAAAIASALEKCAPYHAERIAVEASAGTIPLVRRLRTQGFTVIVCESRKVSRYLRVRVNKTDSNDARGLAEVAKIGPSSLTRVHVKSPTVQKLRSQLVFRHKLILHRVACEGMIRSLVKLNGGHVTTPHSDVTFERNVRHALKELELSGEADLAEEITQLLTLALQLRTFLTSLERKLTRWAVEHPVCSRLMSVPGVGAICAVSFYTAIEDPDRFERPVDVGAYLGLTPRVLQSGTTLRHEHISRRGNKLTRSHLTLAAGVIIARCRPNPLKIWALTIAERAGPGKARVALARKLAILMLVLWKSGTCYDATYGSPIKQCARS